MIFKTTYESPIGIMTLASNGEALTGLWNENQKYHGNGIYKKLIHNDNLDIFNNTKIWLGKYFEGKKPNLNELMIATDGSELRKLIWNILCEIPYGEVTTYGDIAKKVSISMNREKMSSQAVGGAVGHNPISIIIPCHRVVGSSGSLTGYAGGIEMKIKLLELEGLNLKNFSIPKKGTAL